MSPSLVLDYFQNNGTIPDWSDLLKMVVIGSARLYANSLTM